MDLTFLLILDAIALFVATVVITYLFLKDYFKQKKDDKNNIDNDKGNLGNY